jgi:CheY-like chemotaxis protein
MDNEKDDLIAMLKKQSGYKTEFLNNMSHELRTPLNAILGFASLLKEEGRVTKQKKYLNQITSSGEILLNIISDLLDFSNIKSGKFYLNPTSNYIEHLIEDKVVAMREVGSKKDLSIYCDYCSDISYLVNVDAPSFQQILSNILSNAIKYTSKGHIRVQTKCIEVNNQIKVNIKVSDTGIGMSEEVVKKIFSSFAQGNSSLTKEIEGTGLGLSITKNLCKLMNGDIAVESTEGVGTTFYFDLVLDNAVQGSGRKNLPDKKEPSNLVSYEHLRVLIVEDNIVNQKLVSAQLKKILGYAPPIAQDGVEAMELLKNQDFNFVFMDISMPRKDGMETTKEIRQIRSESTDLYIVALTANAVHGDKEKYLSIGMDDYISKPASSNSLKRVLQNNILTKEIIKKAS